jgi:hypothetical protein
MPYTEIKKAIDTARGKSGKLRGYSLIFDWEDDEYATKKDFTTNSALNWDDNLLTSSYVESVTRSTVAYITDHEGIVREIPANEIHVDGLRYIENLAASNATQNITVVTGRDYQISFDGTGSVTPATAFTGALTGAAGVRTAYDSAKTAVATTLALTIAGAVNNLMVEDVTGASNDAPSRYIAHGTVAYSAETNGNSVSSNVVTEVNGTAITGAEGLVLEGPRTNLCTHSHEIDNAAWAKQAVTVTAGDATAPNGLDDGDKVTCDGTSNPESVRFEITDNASAVQYAVSLYVKAGGSDSEDATVDFGIRDVTAAAWVACTSRIVSGSGSITTSGNYQQLTGLSQTSWTRVELWMSAAATATNTYTFYAYPGLAGATTTAELHMWGVVMCAHPWTGSYIETNGSTVTTGGSTVADDISSFNPEYGWSEITWSYDSAYTQGDFSTASIMQFGNAATSGYFPYKHSANENRISAYDGTNVAHATGCSYAADEQIRARVVWGVEKLDLAVLGATFGLKSGTGVAYTPITARANVLIGSHTASNRGMKVRSYQWGTEPKTDAWLDAAS